MLPPEDGRLEFRARVPNGDYFVWLCAGPVIRTQYAARHFLLRANDEVLFDELPAPIEYYGRKYLYRFLNTRYSEKPHALWSNYIDRMYPIHTPRVKVTDGTFTLEAENYFVSAVVLVPASAKADFDKFVNATRALRIGAFEKTLRPLPGKKPQAKPGDGAFVVYEPAFGSEVRPWTGPTTEERKRTALQTAAAPGQTVALRLAVTPFADLGSCTLEPSALKGPAELPAGQIAVYSQNYRYDGDNLSEMALMPSATLDVETGVTQCFWLTLEVPDKAAPGTYRGAVTFRPGNGDAVRVPLELEVYPFTLEAVLPVSYGGMYYNPRHEVRGLAAPEVEPPAGEGDNLSVDAQDRLYRRSRRGAHGDGTGQRRFGTDEVRPDDVRPGARGRHGPRPEAIPNGRRRSASPVSRRRDPGHRLIGEDGGLKIDRNPGLELRPAGLPRVLPQRHDPSRTASSSWADRAAGRPAGVPTSRADMRRTPGTVTLPTPSPTATPAAPRPAVPQGPSSRRWAIRTAARITPCWPTTWTSFRRTPGRGRPA